jgi:recombination protein RecR
MSKLPQKLQIAVEQLSKIPGVGSKTALRQVLQLSRWSGEELTTFSQAVAGLASLSHCSKCGMYCDEEICEVCSSFKRIENGVVCVVETITDYLAVEKSEKFYGSYHVLGGVLNPLLGIGPDELNFSSLQKRVSSGEVKSLILALNPSVEGDATCAYIRRILPESISIERIGFGLPIGGSLEYVDSMTISKALENRKVI